jgi:APA family basic amino acid/polyamine antiporter
MGLDLTSTVRVEIPKPVVERETEYDSIIVWFDAARFNEDALATAARLGARRGRSITVLVTMQIPNSVPLDAKTPELKAKARAIIDQAKLLTRGRAVGEIVPVRAGQEGRLIVERARDKRARAVILSVPRGAASRPGLARVLDTVLSERPCRIIVDTPAPTPPKAARKREEVAT